MNGVTETAEGAGGSAQFEHDGTDRIGADLEALGKILVLEADVGEGGEFRLGGDHGPDHDGEGEGEQFPAEILEHKIPDPLERADDIEQASHGCTLSTGGLRVASVVNGISPAKSSICGEGGNCTPKC